MSDYLLIETRDIFETTTVRQDYQLAKDLASAGHRVTLFCAQNGVLPMRKTSAPAGLVELPREGVRLLADDFSLMERGIQEDDLAADIAVSALDHVVDQLAQGARTLWL